MSSPPVSLPSDLPPEAMDDLRILLSSKASDLFGLCDAEDKGFVTKRDMQRMRSELPELDPDQIESVFDTLDGDSNGFLTLEEFTEGFGAFLGLDQMVLLGGDGGGVTAEGDDRERIGGRRKTARRRSY